MCCLSHWTYPRAPRVLQEGVTTQRAVRLCSTLLPAHLDKRHISTNSNDSQRHSSTQRYGALAAHCTHVALCNQPGSALHICTTTGCSQRAARARVAATEAVSHDTTHPRVPHVPHVPRAPHAPRGPRALQACGANWKWHEGRQRAHGSAHIGEVCAVAQERRARVAEQSPRAASK